MTKAQKYSDQLLRGKFACICFQALGLLILQGCTSSPLAPGHEVSDGVNSNPVAVESQPSASSGRADFPIGIDTEVYGNDGIVKIAYDRFVLTEELDSTRATPGCVFLVLHYRAMNEPAKGAWTQRIETNRFAIRNGNNVTYGIDDSSMAALQISSIYKAQDESIEYYGTELHPGVEKRLVTLFQVPVEQLKKQPYLIVPDQSTTKRIPLSSIAQRLGGTIVRKQDDVEQVQTPQESDSSSSLDSNESAKAINSKDSNLSRSTTGEKAQSAEALTEKAIQARIDTNEKDFSNALEGLKSLEKPTPENAEEAVRLNKLGLLSLKTEDYTRASTLFKCAVKADPSVAKYASNLGFSEMYEGNLDSAKQQLYCSLALDSSREVAWDNLGQVYAKQENQERAVACFMIGYQISCGKSLSYLKSLDADDDPRIRESGRLALERLNLVSSDFLRH